MTFSFKNKKKIFSLKKIKILFNIINSNLKKLFRKCLKNIFFNKVYCIIKEIELKILIKYKEKINLKNKITYTNKFRKNIYNFISIFN